MQKETYCTVFGGFNGDKLDENSPVHFCIHYADSIEDFGNLKLTATNQVRTGDRELKEVLAMCRCPVYDIANMAFSAIGQGENNLVKNGAVQIR